MKWKLGSLFTGLFVAVVGALTMPADWAQAEVQCSTCADGKGDVFWFHAEGLGDERHIEDEPQNFHLDQVAPDDCYGAHARCRYIIGMENPERGSTQYLACDGESVTRNVPAAWRQFDEMRHLIGEHAVT